MPKGPYPAIEETQKILIRNKDHFFFLKKSPLLLPPPKLIKCGREIHAAWAIYVMKRSSKNNTQRLSSRAWWQSQLGLQKAMGSPDPCSSTARWTSFQVSATSPAQLCTTTAPGESLGADSFTAPRETVWLPGFAVGCISALFGTQSCLLAVR